MIKIHGLAARCGLAILSGAIYTAAFPPIGWRWLIVPGIAGLILALKGRHGSRARLLGFLHGFTAFGLKLVVAMEYLRNSQHSFVVHARGLHRSLRRNAKPG